MQCYLFIETMYLMQTKYVRIINKIITMCESYFLFLSFQQ